MAKKKGYPVAVVQLEALTIGDENDSFYEEAKNTFIERFSGFWAGYTDSSCVRLHNAKEVTTCMRQGVMHFFIKKRGYQYPHLIPCYTSVVDIHDSAPILLVLKNKRARGEEMATENLISRGIHGHDKETGHIRYLVMDKDGNLIAIQS